MDFFLLILSFVLLVLSAVYSVHVLDNHEEPFGFWLIVRLIREYRRTKKRKYLSSFVFQIISIIVFFISWIIIAIG